MLAIFTLLAMSCLVAGDYYEETFLQIFPQVHRCKRYQKDIIEKCIKSSIISMKPYLTNNIPNMPGIPSFKEYNIEIFDLRLTNEIQGRAEFKNINIYGLSNFDVGNVQVSANIDQIKFDVYFPLIEVKSNYDIHGTMLRIPIRKTGYNMNGNFTHVGANITINGEYYLNNKEREYFRPYNVVMELNIKNSEIQVADVDNNNNVYNNSHTISMWQIIGSHILPEIEKLASYYIWVIANEIYTTFPIQVLMPF